MAHYEFDMPVTESQVRALRVNDTVTLNGTLYGIRDATQIHMFDRGRKTKFDLRGHAVIHTAPNVKWVGETQKAPTGYEPVCVGTTTSARAKDRNAKLSLRMRAAIMPSANCRPTASPTQTKEFHSEIQKASSASRRW